MKHAPVRSITDDEIRRYQEDGVVFLKGLFDKDWVDYLRPLAETALADPSRLHHELAEDDDRGRFFSDTFLWPRHPEFKSFIDQSPAASIAGQVMASEKINIVFDQFLIKEPITSGKTVWHHDLTYWPINGDQVCSMWIALDPVFAETGAVEFVKGSHRWGQRYQAVAFADPGRYDDGLPKLPDIEAMRDDLEILQFEFEPGDCTLHHGLTIHGAPGNQHNSRRRRAYVLRWAGDDVVYHPRPKIQPMLWDPDIPAGGPIDCDLWPMVWQRNQSA